MKFIGQNIQDFISRFRNDVFLESISTGTIASGGNLGLDSNNKIVKATVSSSSGDIEGVTAGTGLSGGGTTGTVTLNVSGLTISEFAAASLTTSSESFADNDTTLMTSAAINDRIESFGYTTNTGDITGVTITADDSNVATDTSGSADFTIAGGAGVRTTISGTTVTAGLDVSDLGGITSLTALTTIGAAGATTNIAAGDLTMYNTVNDGNPSISLGSSDNERVKISAVYESGAQGLDVVQFESFTAGASTNDARYSFKVDESFLLLIKDAGLQIKASGALEIGNGNAILSDSSGTTTLSNIDALDATTESTIETAIDTLSNLTTVGTIGTGVWQGTAINQTYLAGQSGTNTGDETLASVNALDITEVGTIDSGVWQGTAIASAYLDADTAHYSATRQVTHHMITDDIDSDVIYISLLDSDSETSTATNKQLPFIAPTAGKLLKIFLRTSVDYSSETFTWKLYTRNVSSGTGGAPSEIGAQSGAGPTNKTMVTYDFTSSLDSGTNAIAAGDKVQISIEAGDGATANGNYFITCLWEWDLS